MAKAQKQPPIEEQPDEFAITPKRVNLEGTPVDLNTILEELMPTGKKLKVEDILDQEIVIYEVKPVLGSQGPFFFVIFGNENGELCNATMGGGVLVEKIAAVQYHLPVKATIVKAEGGRFGWYYDFAS